MSGKTYIESGCDGEKVRTRAFVTRAHRDDTKKEGYDNGKEGTPFARLGS